MKVVQILPYYFPLHSGGLEKIAHTISNGLDSLDWISVLNIVTPIRTHNEIDTLPDDETTIFLDSFDLIDWFPIPKFRKKCFWQTLQKAKKTQPDVIMTHTRFFLQSLLGWLLAKSWWCKRIHIEHGSGFVTWYPRYIKLFAWLFDRTIGLWIFRQCDTVVTISQMHKHFIAKFTKKDPIVIYNPIDFTPQEKVKNVVPHIWFVWRLVPLKWVDILIHALKNLEGKERICTIVGDWSQRQLLEELVDSLWLKSRILFVWADDRTNRLHKFDIFVNPSYQEWVPTTVVEALMARCIVVATDVGGTKEITTEEDLLLCKPWSCEDLMEKLLIAFNHLDRCGNSYEIVNEKFAVAKAIERYRKIFIW